MVERRSLGEAMSLSPEKLAFIKGQSVKEAASPGSQETKEKTIELVTNEEAQDSSEMPRAGTRRPRRGRAGQQRPDASEILDQVRVPKTIRLQRRTAQALDRAYLEQKLMHAKPCTVQDIAEEALADWLEKAGYLD